MDPHGIHKDRDCNFGDDDRLPKAVGQILADFTFGTKLIKIPLDIPIEQNPALVEQLNEVGLPEREVYRTADVCEALNLRGDTLRWRLKNGYYPAVAPRRDNTGRLFSLSEIVAMLKTPPTPSRGQFAGLQTARNAIVSISLGQPTRSIA